MEEAWSTQGAVTFTLDDRLVSARGDASLLEACRDNGVALPTLCHFDGLSEVGACRLCLVEIAGTPRLAAACVTPVTEGLLVRTDTERLRRYRRQIVELLFAERVHFCAICVANGRCELQQLGYAMGIEHVRYQRQSPRCALDTSHSRFVHDPARCVSCSRCVRVCDEIEGAHTWDVAFRGERSRVIVDLARPWGSSETCTGCGKCVQVCPTGALFEEGADAGARKPPSFLSRLRSAREKQRWIP